MKLMVLDIFYKGKEYYGLKIFHMLRSLPVVQLPYLVLVYSGHFQVPTGIGGRRAKFCEQIMNVAGKLNTCTILNKY
jgi:hypothetical protein